MEAIKLSDRRPEVFIIKSLLEHLREELDEEQMRELQWVITVEAAGKFSFREIMPYLKLLND